MTIHRLGVVGLGMAVAPHIAALRDLAGRVAVAGCFARSAESRARFGAGNPDLPLADDLDALLADPAVTGLLILTPPWTHHELVAKAAAAGKHVLIEKPLDVDPVRARESVAAMERAGRRFAVMLQHRFRAGSLRLAALLAAGELGPLISGSAAIRWWRSDAYYREPGRGMLARDGGGVLLTQAVHTLDLLLSLAGPVATVAAIAATSPLRRIDGEDVVGAGIRFASGAVGTIDATTVAYPGFPERIELACAHATAILAADGLDLHWKDGRHERFAGGEGGGGGADPMAFSHGAHRALIADWLDAIEQQREPRVAARSVLAVQNLIAALLESARTGRSVTVGVD